MSLPTPSPGDAPRPGRSQRGPALWAGLAVGVVLAAWLVAPVAGGRAPAGEDVTAHLVRADFGISQLVNHGRLDGWFPRFVLGHAEFLFNGPGLTWAMAAVRGLTAGALSNAGALKLVGAAAFVATPLAVAFVARSYGLGRRAAGLAAVLALLVSNRYGPGLHGLYRVGLVSHQVGAVFFWLALGACLRAARDSRPRWTLLAGASLAALAVTHLISVMVLAVVLCLSLTAMAATRRLPAEGLARLLAAGALGVGLAGFWAVPFLAHRRLAGVVVTWGTPPLGTRLGAIVEGRYLLPAGLAVIMGLAMLAEARRLRRRPQHVTWVVTPLAYLLVAHGALWLVTNDLTLQLANRGLGYAAILGMLPLAALTARATRPWGPRGHAAVLAVAALTVVVWAPGRHAPGQLAEPKPALRAAAAQLARLVPDGARFVSERDFPTEMARTGVIHPEMWLAWKSGRNTLNGFNIESSNSPYAALEAFKLTDRSPAVNARRLARFGVTHVVATQASTVRRLTGSGRFRTVWEQTPITILEIARRANGPSPGSLLSAGVPLDGRLVAAQPEHLRFVAAPERAATVTVAVAWSPKWRARLDGRPIPLEQTGDGLIRYHAPAGEHRLRLDYRNDGWDRLGLALTVLTVAALGLGAWRRPRGQLMSRIFSRTA